MAQTFISYSREDRSFVVRLQEALIAQGREVWVDLSDILPSAKWLEEVFAGIDAADAFLYVLSPASVASPFVQQELEHALEVKKRIVPVVYREVDPKVVHPEVVALNWIFFRASDDFNAAFEQLTFALDTDLAYWHQSSQLLTRAHQWDAKHQDPSLTLRGSELEEAERWLADGATKKPSPTALHTRFITASRRVATSRQRRLLAAVSVALVVTLVLSAVSTVLLQVTRNENQVLSAEALAGEADSAISNGRLDQALLLGVEASRRADTFATRNALIDALEASPNVEAVLRNDLVSQGGLIPTQSAQFGPLTPEIDAIAFSSTGQTLMSDDVNGVVTVWNTATHHVESQFTTTPSTCGVPFYPPTASLSPDGTLVATSDQCGDLFLWSARTGAQMKQLHLPHVPQSNVTGVAFTPDGMTVATPVEPRCVVGSTCPDPSVELWDPSTGTIRAQMRLDSGAWRPLPGIAVSSDGRLLAVLETDRGATEVVLGDPHTGVRKAIYALPTSLMVNASPPFDFRPHGHTLAIGVTSGARGDEILYLDTTTGQLTGQPLILSDALVTSFAFAPDGQQIITASLPSFYSNLSAGSPALQRWDVASGTPIGPPLAGSAGAMVVAISRDGQHFASDTGENLLLWRLSPHTSYSISLGSLPQEAGSPHVSAPPFIPRSNQLVLVDSADDLVVWDAIHRRIQSMLPHAGLNIQSIAISQDGHTAIVGDEAGAIGIWDLRTNSSLGNMRASDALSLLPNAPNSSSDLDSVGTVSLSPDGHYLLVTGFQILSRLCTTNGGISHLYNVGETDLWDLSSRTPREVFVTPAQEPFGPPPPSAAFSPDGRYLAMPSMDPKVYASITGNSYCQTLPSTINLWDLAAGKVVKTWSGPSSYVAASAFSPDGQTLATLGWDGTLQLWSVGTGKLLATLDGGQRGHVVSSPGLSFTGGGNLLIASYDSTIALWEVSSRALFIRPLFETSPLIGTSVSPDSRLLAAADQDGSIDIRYVQEADWQAEACSIANRNFTTAEWEQFFGSESYHKTCPQFPAP